MNKIIMIIVLFLVITSCKTPTKSNLSIDKKDRKLICELVLLDSQYLDIILINQTDYPLQIPPALGANDFQVYVTNPSGKEIGPGHRNLNLRSEILDAGKKKIMHLDYLDFILGVGHGKETGNYKMEFIIEEYGIHEFQQVYYDYEAVTKY